MTNCNTETPRKSNPSSALVRDYLGLALSGLAPMFDSERQLFCHRRKLTPAGLVNEGLSPRYTMMTLLGLFRCEKDGWQLPIQILPAVRSLLSNKDQLHDVGDRGLLLWLCSVVAPEHLSEACAGLDLAGVLKQSQQGAPVETMGLAWLLAGLAHAKMCSQKETESLKAAAFESFELLKRNQGLHGAFGHSTGGGLTRSLRGHIGSFADQVYPIYALAKFGQAYGMDEAVHMASRCADRICQAQGSLGQWWWHYDSRTGRVFERYPVYSTHQHGMAPMALFALADATGNDFRKAIYSGLSWVSENNELGQDLADNGQKLIWRGVYRGSKPAILTTRALSLLGREDQTEPPRDLLVRSECRPYELGWLLYAFAGRQHAS